MCVCVCVCVCTHVDCGTKCEGILTNLAGISLRTCYLFAEVTLTVDNLVGVMDRVTRDKRRRITVWEGVLITGIAPRSFLDEVFTKYAIDEVTYHLSDVYVNIRPKATWQNVVYTLYEKGEVEAAKKAKTFLQHYGG